MTKRLGIDVEVAKGALENLQDADVIITATSSFQPVLPDSDIPTGVHINAVGAYRADMAEVPPTVVCRSRVVVDHHASAPEEAGDLLGPLQQRLIRTTHFDTELGDLLLGRSPGRSDAREMTLFKSVGVAIQDLYAAKKSLDNARRIGLGVPLL